MIDPDQIFRLTGDETHTLIFLVEQELLSPDDIDNRAAVVKALEKWFEHVRSCSPQSRSCS